MSIENKERKLSLGISTKTHINRERTKEKRKAQKPKAVLFMVQACEAIIAESNRTEAPTAGSRHCWNKREREIRPTKYQELPMDLSSSAIVKPPKQPSQEGRVAPP